MNKIVTIVLLASFIASIGSIVIRDNDRRLESVVYSVRQSTPTLTPEPTATATLLIIPTVIILPDDTPLPPCAFLDKWCWDQRRKSYEP